MSEELKLVEEQALKLSPEDREELAAVIMHSLEPASAPAEEVEEAWAEEAERRFQTWRAGESKGVPAGEFLADIRRELGWL